MDLAMAMALAPVRVKAWAFGSVIVNVGKGRYHGVVGVREGEGKGRVCAVCYECCML